MYIIQTLGIMEREFIFSVWIGFTVNFKSNKNKVYWRLVVFDCDLCQQTSEQIESMFSQVTDPTELYLMSLWQNRMDSTSIWLIKYNFVMFFL